MQAEIKKLEEKGILVLSTWWGLRNPGSSGVIVTKDKNIYSYKIYYMNTPFLEENNIPLEYLSKPIKLSEENYNKVINFIEKEIFSKNYDVHRIYDVGDRVFVNYKDNYFNYPNCYDSKTGESLYDKTRKLIETLKNRK